MNLVCREILRILSRMCWKLQKMTISYTKFNFALDGGFVKQHSLNFERHMSEKMPSSINPLLGFWFGNRRNPMKSDRIRLYFPRILIGFASQNPIAREPTTSRLDPIETFLGPTEFNDVSFT